MRSRLEIMEAFAQIAAAREDVRLINDHRGIPVSYEASIISVQAASIVLRVHKNQCVCLELERFTYIQSPSLPAIIKGRVANLDFSSTLATLTSFERASETIGRRTLVRVQPKDPLDVMIIYQGQKIRGNLADISSNGIGVFMMSAYVRNPGVLKKSEQVQMVIRLPGEKGMGSEVRLVGTILYVNPDKGSFRLGLNTNPEAHAKTLISQYVNQRQAEILRELKVLYEKFYRMKLENQNNP